LILNIQNLSYKNILIILIISEIISEIERAGKKDIFQSNSSIMNTYIMNDNI